MLTVAERANIDRCALVIEFIRVGDFTSVTSSRTLKMTVSMRLRTYKTGSLQAT
jgi:hypothetical protein